MKLTTKPGSGFALRTIELQEMGKELRSMLSPKSHNITQEQKTVAADKVHCYRGVAQQVTNSTRTGAQTAPPSDASKRIYRGRVIAG